MYDLFLRPIGKYGKPEPENGIFIPFLDLNFQLIKRGMDSPKDGISYIPVFSNTENPQNPETMIERAKENLPALSECHIEERHAIGFHMVDICCPFFAAALTHPPMLRKISSEYFKGKSMYILPSSIDDLIFLDAEEEDAVSLKNIVEDINTDPKAIEREKVLSDNVYFYNAETGIVSALFETTD